MIDPRYGGRHGSNRRARPNYLKTKLETADRLELLLMTFDAGVEAARKKDKATVRKALEQLKNGLRITKAAELTVGLMMTYTHCERAIDANNFKFVESSLAQLRDAFAQYRFANLPDDVLHPPEPGKR